jgi:hypothetical protein
MERFVIVALLLAVGIAGLSALALDELLVGDQLATCFWIALPVAAVASLLGAWVGGTVASGGRSLPGWRGAKWGAAAGLGLAVLLLPLGVGIAIVFSPVTVASAGASGSVTAFFISKGSHGKA